MEVVVRCILARALAAGEVGRSPGASPAHRPARLCFAVPRLPRSLAARWAADKACAGYDEAHPSTFILLV